MTAFRCANIHITGRCNYGCLFCFTRNLVREELTFEQWKPIFEDLRAQGVEKINFVGGEPFLYPYIKECLRYCKDLGFTVTVVSNGSVITRELLGEVSPYLDWLGLSVDSTCEDTEIMLRRHCGGVTHIEHVKEVSRWAKELGIANKLNITVVNQSKDDDFHGLISEVDPLRVKVFQALRVEDMNGENFARIEVSDEDFETFRQRHSDIVLSNGTCPVFESSDDMEGSYLMIDPKGRIMDDIGNETHYHDYWESIGDVDSIISHEKFISRGGEYDWEKKKAIAVYGISHSGKDFTIEDAQKILESEGLHSLHISHIGLVHKNLGDRRLKGMSPEDKEILLTDVRREFADAYMEGNVIADRHCCFPQTYNGKEIHNGYYDEKLPYITVRDPVSGRDYDVVFDERDLVGTDAAFYIDTPSEIILDRFHTSEGCKHSEDVTLEDISCWKDFEIRYLKRFFADRGIPFTVLSEERNIIGLAEGLRKVLVRCENHPGPETF